MICGGELTYLSTGQEFTCHLCGKKETGNIHCATGHYVCDSCHGEKVFELVQKMSLNNKLTDPLTLAERMMAFPQIPMLGCENAWIVAGAFLSTVRNEGTINVSSEDISEALRRTRRQAIGGYCGLTGACGIPLAIGASFSILLGAACPKDRETALTMQILAKTVAAVALETGPCCCKNFARTSLQIATSALEEHFQVKLPISQEIQCKYVDRHPHGCRKDKCRYYRGK